MEVDKIILQLVLTGCFLSCMQFLKHIMLNIIFWPRLHRHPFCLFLPLCQLGIFFYLFWNAVKSFIPRNLSINYKTKLSTWWWFAFLHFIGRPPLARCLVTKVNSYCDLLMHYIAAVNLLNIKVRTSRTNNYPQDRAQIVTKSAPKIAPI